MTPVDPTPVHESDLPRAEIAVIGGSGLYELLTDFERVSVPTPFGDPSDDIVVGEVAGRRVAFVPRHGAEHRYPPHLIPYRANLWALRALGVGQVLAPCAVGSLTADLGPGSLVVPDQVVDRTSGRAQTYVDHGAVHVPFADPYCPVGRAAAVQVATEHGWPVTDGGTMVVVEGPRFSSRAESQWFARQGWTLVNMTGFPEAVLAREMELCYTPLALVTDLDAGLETGDHVTQDEVFRVFSENTDRLRTTLLELVRRLPLGRECDCGSALAGIDHRIPLP